MTPILLGNLLAVIFSFAFPFFEIKTFEDSTAYRNGSPILYSQFFYEILNHFQHYLNNLCYDTHVKGLPIIG